MALHTTFRESKKKLLTGVLIFFVAILFFALQLREIQALLTITGGANFLGNLAVTGSVSKGSGTFVIDHPLMPFTHLLYHSFVESPKVLNIYKGEARLNSLGEVTVELPEYFKALNTDYEYYLEPIGKSMPNLFIKEEIKDTSFVIGGGVREGRVSWHVSGVRRDPYILANPIIPDVLKTDVTLVKKGECIYEPLCE